MEIQDKIRQYLGEDATDQEKHDKLNDIFQSLERLNDEVYELEFLDAKEGASGVGDLNDQLTTFRKLISGLYQVLDRATKVVPMEAREGEVEEADEIIQSIPSKTVKLAGDSIWDRDGENPESVQVSSVTIENPYEPGGYMDDDEDDGYRKVDVEHNGPWSIYTDSGFAEGISGLVGFPVDFTEQGMQQDGMASMEGTMGDAMESANVTEGYEGKVLGILKKEGIGAYFSGGKLYIDQADMSEAKSVLSDNDEIKELPDMVAETLQDSDLSRVKKLAGI